MKKLTYIIPVILIVILSVVCVFFIVKGVGSTETVEICVSEIHYRSNGLSLGELEVKEWNRDPPTSMMFTPVDANELMIRVVSSEYYKGNINYNGRDGYYFVKNNNAYFLYNIDDCYYFKNMYSICDDMIKEYSYRVASPDIINFDFDVYVFPETLQFVDSFFNKKTYSGTRQFYSNFDNGFAVYDDTEQTIKVKVYDDMKGEYTQTQRIIFDFVKKDIGVIGDDGSIEWARDRLAEINSGT